MEFLTAPGVRITRAVSQDRCVDEAAVCRMMALVSPPISVHELGGVSYSCSETIRREVIDQLRHTQLFAIYVRCVRTPAIFVSTRWR